MGTRGEIRGGSEGNVERAGKKRGKEEVSRGTIKIETGRFWKFSRGTRVDLHEEGDETGIPVGKCRHVVIERTGGKKKLVFVRFRGDFRGTGGKERFELADENGVHALQETRISLQIGRTFFVQGLHHRSPSHVHAIGKTEYTRRCG